ncbi:hypothetical protein [Shewanella colwelliana]|uniref:hypothetical protein n=1 Tax=Shewanella colwelliana TaxID=23 RepID=UPI0004B0137D|nr:hypothetical protein [Shewanella colwelliana]
MRAQRGFSAYEAGSFVLASPYRRALTVLTALTRSTFIATSERVMSLDLSVANATPAALSLGS